MKRQRIKFSMLNSMADDSLLVEATAATLGAILTIGPFALLFFNLI